MAKLLALFLAVYYFFTPYAAPSAEQPINTLRSDVKLTVAAWADPQVSNYILKRHPVFIAAAEDLTNAAAEIDALVVAGDITENGMQCEYDEVYAALEKAPVKNYIMATGNHDIRLRIYKNSLSRFADFTNSLNKKAGSTLEINSMHYSHEVNGYTFLVLGSDSTQMEEADISPEQLKWLDDSLAAACGKGKPVFVVVHQALPNTNGLPVTWGSGNSATGGSIGKQADELKAILNAYQDVIFITGHMHTGMGRYTYEKVGNIHCVNLPSVTIDNKDGEDNGPGVGYMIEVYENQVVFRGRNFAKGEYVSGQDFTIELGSATVGE